MSLYILRKRYVVLVTPKFNVVILSWFYNGSEMGVCISVENTIADSDNVFEYKINDVDKAPEYPVVYQVNCKKCGKLYIGETGRTARDRLKEHRVSNEANQIMKYACTGCPKANRKLGNGFD